MAQQHKELEDVTDVATATNRANMADRVAGGGKRVDLAIIGGGPTGLFAAFYAGLRGMSVKIIDSLEVLGGQLVTLYPEKYIYDVAGFPRVLAKDLATALIAQAMQAKPILCLGEQVSTLDFDAQSRVYTIHTSRARAPSGAGADVGMGAGAETRADAAHAARAILIAAGVGSFAPRTLPLAERFIGRGRGLHYFVSDPEAFAEKRVLIVGGGDSAVDWANALAPRAASVTLIHRRDRFRAHEDSVRRMHQSDARILTFHELKQLDGRDRVERAVIFDNRSGAESTLEVDEVLVNIGFQSTLGPIGNWGLEIEGGQIKVDSMMQTIRPGIFAAGDVATFPGKLKLIATGFGEACIAVNYARHFLDPAANIFPGHSSDLKR
jgi:thioredoxin reductase (NADPH)